MDRTLIAWNLPNWISIVLMAAIGYFVLGLASQFVQRNLPGGMTASPAPAAPGY